MAIIVVGGQTRGVGKTSVICGLIAALPERKWAAIKISTHGYSDYVEVHEEFDRASGTDSSRYLEAGAVRSFFVTAPPGQTKEAVAALEDLLQGFSDWMVEATSVLEWMRPDVALAVVDPVIAEIKSSLQVLASRFDAVLLPAGTSPPEAFAHARAFEIRPPQYCNEAIVAFVLERFSTPKCKDR